MSKLKRAIIAMASALGLSVAMITPASAAIATHSCGSFGTITMTAARVSPPNVRINLTVSPVTPAPMLPGSVVLTLYPAPGVVPAFNVTNPA